MTPHGMTYVKPLNLQTKMENPKVFSKELLHPFHLPIWRDTERFAKLDHN